MSYRYETHMHTSQGSACSDTPGHAYIQPYMDAGYDGIIITDHFFRGNCAVDRSLPWRERIHIFCSGYEDALNEGIRRGYPVFFGWEENFAGDEYLIYGLDKTWLLEHPEVENCTRLQLADMVHADGGCIVQAHPFRARSYISMIHLSPELVDGVEVFNAGNLPAWDALAFRYAERLRLPATAGSDMHHADRMGPGKLAGIELDKPLHSIHDLVEHILQRRPIGLYLPGEAPQWTPDLRPDLPAEILDAQARPTGRDVCGFLRG